VDKKIGGGSFLHKLDPRTKLILTVLFTVLVFIINSLAVAAVLMIFFFVLGLLSGLTVKKIFPHGKIIVFVIVMAVILQILFGRETPETRYILKPLIPEYFPLAGGAGSLKLDGLFSGLMIGCRIMALSILLPLLVITTEPRLLALGITRLGINYRAAFIITSTLNLVPLFEEEGRNITETCRLRGINVFEKGNIFSKLKEYSVFAFPLIIKSMKRSSIMGLAMDARAFGAFKTRTWLLQIRMKTADYLTFSAGIVFTVIAVMLNYTIKI